MKKTYIVVFAFLLSLSISAQNKLAENAARQKTLNFSTITSPGSAINSFKREYILQGNNSFTPYRSSVDKNGVLHQRYQQFYNGVKVEFGMLITHSKNNNVSTVNGELYDTKGISVVPTMSKETAFNHAKNYINAERYLWEDADQARIMDYIKPTGELIVFPNVSTGEVYLAYKFDIYATKPIKRNEVYVNAHTGHVLYENPIIKHANRLVSNNEMKQYADKLEEAIFMASGTAATRYSGSRPVETTFSGGNYVLRDASRGNGINTYNCQTTNTYQTTNFIDNDNNWTSGEHNNAAKDNGALDAHWGAEVTFDFWKNIFGRNSYDDANAVINSYVHYDDDGTGAGYDNAFWNGSAMTYGDGNGFDILTSLDVCGHEIGHAICTYTANLAYQNQSGGMNEGFSDIWGACIEHYGRTGALTGTPVDDVWKIGEDLAFNPLRSMSNPLSRGNPDTYLGTSWTTTGDEGVCIPTQGNDNCGVHNNSGVLNHWFYILTAGKSGTNNAPSPDTYNVTGIGMVKSTEIAYFTERDYLTANSTYLDARNASIAVASSLYCASSPEVISVTNAWYAVNVGEEYSAAAVDVALQTVTEKTSVDCGVAFSPEIKIQNGGSSPLTSVDITFDIDGGTPTNDTWTGNLAVCAETTHPLVVTGLIRGAHILNVNTTTTSDGRPENNTKSSLVLINDSGTENVVNTFTVTTDVLVAYDDGTTTSMWERGAASGTTLSAAVAGNSNVYGTKLSGKHGDKTKAYLVSQCYDLSLLENTFVKFDMAFDIEENWDILYMEYSKDGGVNWSTLGASTDTNWYNSNRVPDGNDCFNCIGAQWTGEAADASSHSGGGTHGTMHNYSFALGAFDSIGSSESNMLFRFVYLSDDAYAEEGVIIDNFVIEGVVNPLSLNDNEFEGLVMYPNPSSDKVIITSNTDLSKATVSIIDLRGRIIAVNAATFSSNKLIVNISSLAEGSYFLKIEDTINTSVKRVIKN
ncbi:MAG: peptidase M4 [Kordia sp.]|nr:MAG: peptidase M4 [Kordia sp.]